MSPIPARTSGWKEGDRAGGGQSFSSGFSARSRSAKNNENLELPGRPVLARLLGVDLHSSSISSLPAEQSLALERKFGRKHLELFSSLSRERSALMFFEGLLQLGRRLEAENHLEAAAEVFAAIVQARTPLPGPPPQGGRGLSSETLSDFPSPLVGEGAPRSGAGEGDGVPQDIRLRAQDCLDAIVGKGKFGLRFEFLGSRLVHEVSDYHKIVPMVAGTAVYGIARTAALARLLSSPAGILSRGFGAQFAASAIGFVPETLTFALGGRALMGISEGGVSGSVGQDLTGAGVTLGLMKLTGWAGQKIVGALRQPRLANIWMAPAAQAGAMNRAPTILRSFVPQGAMFAGLMLAHKAEEELGLRETMDGATTALDAAASLISLGVGSHLGRKALGTEFARFQAELGMRAELLRRGTPGAGGRPFAAETARPAVLGIQHSVATPSALEDLQGPPKPLRMISLGQSIETRQELKFLQTIKISDIQGAWAEAYGIAEKRVYQKHGLDFEYAVVRREQFPYLLSIGSAGLQFGGYKFVMEDFFVDPAIDEALRAKLVELIAVHEYGEEIFGDHHEASMLEFAVALREGFLEEYLKILQEKYFLKFRDVALKRMGKEFRTTLEEYGVEVEGLRESGEPPPDSEDPSIRQATVLRDGFRWPAGLEKYARFLDEDEELAKEKVVDWANHIVVNEQVQGYLRRASEDAVDATRRALEQGKAWEEIPGRIQSAFYGALHPLYLEFDNEVLSLKFLNQELAAAYLTQSHSDILALARSQISTKLHETAARAAAETSLQEMRLFSRDFQAHMEILEFQGRWLELFDVDEFEAEEEGRSKVAGESPIAALISIFWRIDAARENLEADLREDFFKHDLPDIRMNLRRVLEPQDQWGDFTYYLWGVEQAILWRFSRISPTYWKTLGPNFLQAVADALAVQFTAWNRREPDPWKGAKADLVKAMERYGPALENYPDPKPNKFLSMEDWFLEQFKIERYDQAGPGVQAKIAADLVSNWGLVGKELRENARDRCASPRLTAHLLLKSWSEISPFHAHAMALSFLPFLIAKHRLPKKQLKALLGELLLRQPPFSVLEGDRYFQKEFAAVDPPFDKILGMRPVGFPGPRLPLENYFSRVDFRRLGQAVVKKGLAVVRADLKQSLETAGVPLDDAIADLAYLGENFRLPEISRKYHEVWDNSVFWREPEEKRIELVRKILPDLLKIESAKDFLSWSMTEAGKSPTFLKIGLGSWLKEIDAARRKIWVDWFREKGQAKPDLPETLVDYDQIRKWTAASEASIADIVHNYRWLLIHSNPLLRARAGKESAQAGPALEVFRNSRNPRLSRTALFASAKSGSLSSVQKVAELAETDAEAKEVLHALKLKGRQGIPQFFPILAKLAAWDHAPAWDALADLVSAGRLDALRAIADSPFLRDEESYLRRTVLPKLDLRPFRGQVTAAPSLELLIEHGLPAAANFLPMEKSTQEILGKLKELSARGSSLQVAVAIQNGLEQLDQKELVKLAQAVEEKLQIPKWRDRAGGLRLMKWLLPLWQDTERPERVRTLFSIIPASDSNALRDLQEILDEVLSRLPPMEAVRIRLAQASVDRGDLKKLPDLYPRLAPDEVLMTARELEALLKRGKKFSKRAIAGSLSQILPFLAMPERLPRVLTLEGEFEKENDFWVLSDLASHIADSLPHLNPSDRLPCALAVEEALKKAKRKTGLARALVKMLPHLDRAERFPRLEFLMDLLHETEDREFWMEANRLLGEAVEHLGPVEAALTQVHRLQGKYEYILEAKKYLTDQLPKLTPDDQRVVLVALLELCEQTTFPETYAAILSIFGKTSASIPYENRLQLAEWIEERIKHIEEGSSFQAAGAALADIALSLEPEDRLPKAFALREALRDSRVPFGKDSVRKSLAHIAESLSLRPRDQVILGMEGLNEGIIAGDEAAKGLTRIISQADPEQRPELVQLVEEKVDMAFGNAAHHALKVVAETIATLKREDRLPRALTVERLYDSFDAEDFGRAAFAMSQMIPNLNSEDRLPRVLAMERLVGKSNRWTRFYHPITYPLAQSTRHLDPDERPARAATVLKAIPKTEGDMRDLVVKDWNQILNTLQPDQAFHCAVQALELDIPQLQEAALRILGSRVESVGPEDHIKAAREMEKLLKSKHLSVRRSGVNGLKITLPHLADGEIFPFLQSLSVRLKDRSTALRPQVREVLIQALPRLNEEDAAWLRTKLGSSN